MAMALLTAVSISSCGGDSAAADLNPGESLQSPVLLGVGAGDRAVSGAPAGIYVTWNRVDDPRAIGYFLYRDTQSIPNPDPGESLNPGLRVNDGNMIPNPGSGATVTHDDIFSVVVGQTYFYRLTVVNLDGDESDPSNELSWTISLHTAGNVTPGTAFWGDDVVVDGTNFLAYNASTDFVVFPTYDGGTVQGAIVDWQDTAITVTVPEPAVSGPLGVLIDGVVSFTDNSLTILNPTIGELDPNPGFVGQATTIRGVNFGATQDPGDEVLWDGVSFTGTVNSWSDTEIEIVVPVDAMLADVQVIKTAVNSNTVQFVPRAEILSVDNEGYQAGEEITLTGRNFGSSEGTAALEDATVLSIVSWADTSVTLQLDGSAGAHGIVLSSVDNGDSNSFDYTLGEPLTVELSGFTAGQVYRSGDDTAAGVSTAADAELVELLLGGNVIASSDTAPFDGMSLIPGEILNGAYDIQLRASRRSISVTTDSLEILIYSLVGDINADGSVDELDRDALEPLITTPLPPGGIMPWWDTDEDGIVTEADLSLVGFSFGNILSAE
ncbi:IPT/TIG domain-containing protein [bacterium]|nr:IPT/TIG domain-containing protein [bacterium]